MRKLLLIASLLLCGAIPIVLAVRGQCALSPDGSFRWQRPDEWFVDSDCDVWSGVVPRKPISAFEIEYRNARVRLYPDRKASIILEKTWDDDLGVFDKDDEIILKSEKALRDEGYRIIGGRVSNRTANEVTALIAPMRDFAGWKPDGYDFEDYLFPGISGKARRQLREYLALDDPLTRIASCSGRIYDGGFGWTILHSKDGVSGFGGTSFFQGIGCANPAAKSGQIRVERAASLLIDALNASAIVSQHYSAVRDPR